MAMNLNTLIQGKMVIIVIQMTLVMIVMDIFENFTDNFIKNIN